MGSADFPPGFFDRAGTERRGELRLDDAAVAAVRDLYSDLEIDGRVLDLCASSAAHFDVPPDELLALDADPDERLAYDDAAFDDVLCSNGVAALTRPLQTFAEVARVLRPGGRFVCTFAGQVHAPTAIRGWLATDDTGRVRLVRGYFARTPDFRPAQSDLRTSLSGAGDRLWAVWATRD